ncbi:putative phosphoacetylglucosamine mutase [Dipodascopsis tothii]|uniref:putative phosphoacetylglucosamine mutase n=1 Tax=Dipodascopsis tothii TaxID=44089 RepID=UPI0034CF73B1
MFAHAHAHPKPANTFAYGTAGFRTKADLLDSVVYRTGLLAALRSAVLGGQTVGVMVTASHNPPADNGVKIVDPLGNMMDQAWEALATQLANAPDSELEATFEAIKAQVQPTYTGAGSVVFARDTRASGPALIAALKDGLADMGATAIDMGLQTTPQLHYVTRCLNSPTDAADAAYFGQPTEEGYFAKLAAAFGAIVGDTAGIAITIDAANGVGAPKAKLLAEHIPAAALAITVVNDDTANCDVLNSRCGADYVKTTISPPPALTLVPNTLYCSFDGDADRIVFYYADAAGAFHLLDGDRIAALATKYLKQLVAEAGLDLAVGVVQTAYANGNSTTAIGALGVNVTCTPTGVKHLHKAAHENYDVGVYFEANGHGTVLFSDRALAAFRAADAPAGRLLHSFGELINQTVGDSVSDMLMVLAILHKLGWAPGDWDAMYTDLPNTIRKMEVADRTIFKTTNAERQLVAPEGLQAKIDAANAAYPAGRCFVRASGTEDVIRVYAEAATDADLAALVANVFDALQPYKA